MAEATESEVRNLVLTVCHLKQGGDVPAARAASQIVTVGTKIYLHGGADQTQAYGDLNIMEIEKGSWRSLSVGGFGIPSPRYGHTFTAYNQKIVLFGGLHSEPTDELSLEAESSSFPPPPFMDSSKGKPWNHRGVPSNQLFILQTNNITWSEPETTGGPRPSSRSMHASIVFKDYLLIFGGSEDATLETGKNDIYLLNLETLEWLPIEPTGDIPSPRVGHKMVYDAARDRAFMFGGADDDGTLFTLDLSDIGTTNTVNWKRLGISGTAPLARSYHSLNLVGDRLFAFAGLTNLPGVSDLYIFEIHKNRWSRPLYEAHINVRAHAAAVLHDKLIVFGGVREKGERSSDQDNGRRISKKLFFLNVLEIREGGESDFKFKFVTVGDTGVGKSCLLTRFVQDAYSEFHVSTIGVDYKSVMTMLKGKLITLQLWDTAGQERFSGVTGSYYRNADGFILVFDATRRESFLNIDAWLKQIEEHHECGATTIKLLIGNKSDLNPKVSFEEARQLADRIGALYVAASAKTALNVDTAFLFAASQLVDIRKKAATSSESGIRGGGGAEATSTPSISLGSTQRGSTPCSGRCNSGESRATNGLAPQLGGTGHQP